MNMKWKWSLLFLTGSMALVPTGTSWATIYKCPGKNGSIEFTSVPCEDGERRIKDGWVNIEEEKKARALAEQKRQETIQRELEQLRSQKGSRPTTSLDGLEEEASPPQVSNSPFQCDGRTHCSQMRSCEEAIYFLNNCPNTKIDGDNDGIPCEEQWCGHGGVTELDLERWLKRWGRHVRR
ncbi:MAG: excalibur calcium-binding domain-containing protein [Pseudomonadota bacterium]